MNAFDVFLFVFCIAITFCLGIHLHKKLMVRREIARDIKNGIIYPVNGTIEFISGERYISISGKKRLRFFARVAYEDKNGRQRLAKVIIKSPKDYREGELISINYNSIDHHVYDLYTRSLVVPILSFIFGVILCMGYIFLLIV